MIFRDSAAVLTGGWIAVPIAPIMPAIMPAFGVRPRRSFGLETAGGAVASKFRSADLTRAGAFSCLAYSPGPARRSDVQNDVSSHGCSGLAREGIWIDHEQAMVALPPL